MPVLVPSYGQECIQFYLTRNEYYKYEFARIQGLPESGTQILVFEAGVIQYLEGETQPWSVGQKRTLGSLLLKLFGSSNTQPVSQMLSQMIDAEPCPRLRESLTILYVRNPDFPDRAVRSTDLGIIRAIAATHFQDPSSYQVNCYDRA